MKTILICLLSLILAGCGDSNDTEGTNNNAENNPPGQNNPPEDQDQPVAMQAQINISEGLGTPWAFAAERPVGTLSSTPDSSGVYNFTFSASSEVSGHTVTLSFGVGTTDEMVGEGTYEFALIENIEYPAATGSLVFTDLESTYDGEARHSSGTLVITSIEDGPIAQSKTISGTFTMSGEGTFASGREGDWTYEVTEGSFEGMVVNVL
ncbi:hypothetical protein FRD01_06090 [Microvenator marinus]|uniref:Uncharacterized protein n=1 Tax=Microvenator marinus TaxID=2600177 RepID=A0A5B8XNU6_9DELT|nr:hypothetical protein [Microvenator marinus]QED26817.1 hypothetical protein FRD01_06090 [Microvenator marinus]